ncbi:gas vesicle protein [Streptomyces xinghaiensis]|uniref:gas vesicle protein n=1 Tax=Streptomyces xinghaiensis TaxID=1038928 RepID=UPI000BB07705|nr:gas vesicle protein [Streptomyces xinghaiensis]
MREPDPIRDVRGPSGAPAPAPRAPATAVGTGRYGGGARALEPQRGGEGSLAHVVETLLDKGLVLNADIMVSVAGVELLGIRLRAALASFETAARYGLEFPSGTDVETAAWREVKEDKESCPECHKRVPTRELLDEWCPWCGWRSAKALSRASAAEAAVDGDGSGGGEAAEAGAPAAVESGRTPDGRRSERQSRRQPERQGGPRSERQPERRDERQPDDA